MASRVATEPVVSRLERLAAGLFPEEHVIWNLQREKRTRLPGQPDGLPGYSSLTTKS